MKKIILVGAARPNFMKIAPLLWASERYADKFEIVLVHTGQHYDYEMSSSFFYDLNIRKPDYFLNSGSGSHAEQTGKVMVEFEKVCLKEKPDIVMVVGDVNSTLACSVTAKKLNADIAHLEAGLRSGDMTMPEEINRIVTDSISDWFFVSEQSGVDNLILEGKKERVYMVGNIMIDTLKYKLEKIKGEDLEPGEPFAVITLHRPSNVDIKERLKGILQAVYEISKDMKVFFPLHPRTEKNLVKYGLKDKLKGSRVELMPPMSYTDFLKLWKNAKLVLTDSGGIQEETTFLGIPCFTLRQNTERPVTVSEGTNIIVGNKKDNILKEYQKFKAGKIKTGKIPENWDGKTAYRVLDCLLK